MKTEIPILSGNFFPQSFQGLADINILPYMIWGSLVCLLLVVFWRFFTHRIFIEKLELVQGGYVIRGGRYCVAFDKHSKLHYLKPMWGKEKLPYFPEKYFQKAKGLPFFGIKRELSLIFLNKYTPMVSIPPNTGRVGGVKRVDIKRWFFMNEHSRFIEKIKRGDVYLFLSIFAPSLIIFATLIFFSVIVMMQINITENLGDRIDDLFNVLVEMYKE